MPTSTPRNTGAPSGSAMLIAQLFDDCSGPQGAKVAGLYLLLISANLVAWAWALVEFNNHPALLATALLAYAFGLRHAVDADHIAAIDNVIRKLMQGGSGL